MKLRTTILLLAGVLLLCGASRPQPNRENPKDARKIRYAQRKELTNKQIAEAESEEPSDPNAPLSLLPAGAEAPKGEDRPNQAPQTDGLADGVTAAASLDTAPADSGSESSGVRSLAIDGAPYGEARKVVKKQPAPLTPVKTPQVVAAAQPKAAAGPPAIAAAKLATAAPKPPGAKQTPKPAEASKLAAARASKPAATKPAPKSAAPAPVAAKPQQAKPRPEPLLDVNDPPTMETASAETPAQPDKDEARLLDKYLKNDIDGTGRSTDEVRSEDATATIDDVPLDATGGELLASNPELDETQLDPLGVPGETVSPAPNRLRGWLFGLCGLFALGAIVVALPRPRVSAKPDDGLTLIETIGLAEGRQLVILRKKHYALVLGVTRQATHLLEKVSMASLDSDYHSVINTIIKRESETPELWRMRPLFSGSYRTDYAPEERAAPSRRTSLAEMRASLQVVGPAKVHTTPAVRASMSELRERSDAPSVSARSRSNAGGSANREAVIRRIREQARKAS